MARVKEEVGWAVTEGVAAEVGRVREMTEAAKAAINNRRQVSASLT